MREFFHGWRRKVGVAALVMACVLGCIWYRSTLIGDRFSIAGYVGVSQFGSISLGYQPEFSSMPPLFQSHILNKTVKIKLPGGGTMTVSNPRWTHVGQEILLWPLVVPLSLLSAYLILWQPRKRVIVEERPSGQ
jgi:hypothetical protein